jgi:hypothetical protein
VSQIDPTFAEIMAKGTEFADKYVPAPARPQESGLKPLKATCRIEYNPNQVIRGSVVSNGVVSNGILVSRARWVAAGSMFMPVTAAERRELLLGEYPPAVEPTAAEIAAFG